jgi:cytosine/creatinine deaminase
MVSSNAAAAMRIPEYGLQRGAPANFIALQARHVPETVVGRPPERSVYRSGKLIARGGKLQPERNSTVV